MKSKYLALLLLLSACTESNNETISIGEPIFVDEFPQSITLRELPDPIPSALDLKSVKVSDSLLVISHAGTWSVFSTDNGKLLGRVFSIGQGPGEFNYIPRCGASAFVKESGDSLIVYASDKDNGRILRCNLTEYLISGQATVTPSLKSPHISNDVWEVIPINGSSAVLSMPYNDFTGFTRNVLANDSLYEPECTRSLSSVTVDSEDDINILAKVSRCQPGGDMVVEAMIYLNQLNLYTLDGKRGKTICVGPRLDGVDAIKDQFEFNRKNTYVSVSAWPFGFGAIYCGASEKAVQTGFANSTEIQFFDWDGNPIAKTAIPFYTRAFDLDARNKVLYVIDGDNDIMKAYDASAIFEAFNAN